MNRVHDLDTTTYTDTATYWFAMAPIPSWYDDDGDEEAPAEPEVGDVLASTRTCDTPMCRNGREGYWADGGECGHCGATLIVWADPPFVKVVDVGPFVAFDDWDGTEPAFVIDYVGRPTRRANGYSEFIDVAGAQPGGWAVRVEPFEWVVATLADFGPPPSGRPLNEQETP